MSAKFPTTHFWIAGAVLALALILFGKEVSFELNSESKTLSLTTMGIIIAIYMGLCGLSHHVYRKSGGLSKGMSRMHFWTTLLGLLWLTLHFLSLADVLSFEWETIDVFAGAIGLVGLGFTVQVLNMSISLLSGSVRK